MSLGKRPSPQKLGGGRLELGVPLVDGWTSGERGRCTAVRKRPDGCLGRSSHVTEGGLRACYPLLEDEHQSRGRGRQELSLS